ncbi:MAG TPA: NTP transferase domain-containing protein, partial [Thermoanaerobaculia bacterium]|nr:NTP transferase domain-containing protein [Thermoanaerobaculia bacterium]
MNVDLVVMAAGAGSRFGGLKQLVPVGPGGETLTDYAVYDAWRAGIRRAVFV